jgi:hypothetical protein
MHFGSAFHMSSESRPSPRDTVSDICLTVNVSLINVLVHAEQPS